MYLPLGESSGKTNVRRAGARALVGFLFLAFVVGVFAPWHGTGTARPLVEKSSSLASVAPAKTELAFQDRSQDSESPFHYVVDHAGFTVGLLEKGKSGINWRIEDQSSGKWLRFELLDKSATTIVVSTSGNKFVARATPKLTVEYDSLPDRLK